MYASVQVLYMFCSCKNGGLDGKNVSQGKHVKCMYDEKFKKKKIFKKNVASNLLIDTLFPLFFNLLTWTITDISFEWYSYISEIAFFVQKGI